MDLKTYTQLEYIGCVSPLVPSLTPRCSSYWKGSLRVALEYSRLTYPHLNQGELVSSLVHCQNKLNSVVGGRAQGQRKINIIYGVFKQKQKNNRNLAESNSENDAADFPRFSVNEFLEEVCLVKFFHFF